jgi:hypothetical protein
MNVTGQDFRNVFLVGGISITLIIDVGLAIFLLIFFVLFVRQLALFSSNKKSTLLDNVKKRRREVGQLIGGVALMGLAAEAGVAGASMQNLRSIGGDGAKVNMTQSSVKSFIKDQAKALWHFIKSLCGGTKDNANSFGRDGATFLYFQQTFLIYAIVTTIITIAVLIPIHVTGNIPQLYESELCEKSLRYDLVQVPLTCLSDPVTDANLNLACASSGTCNNAATCDCVSGSSGPYCQFKTCGISKCSINGACDSQVTSGSCRCVGKFCLF